MLPVTLLAAGNVWECREKAVRPARPERNKRFSVHPFTFADPYGMSALPPKPDIAQFARCTNGGVQRPFRNSGFGE